ncbi:MAG: hypothetical protein GXP04_02765 [Alphaproteobacteria bacterium]|nr:hypothetical protein [Alphaproteobacteria bacterium]
MVSLNKKTAIILIHGMGEQRPMNALKSFVKSVWLDDDRVSKGKSNQVWSKPDHISESFELRRLTTGQNTAGKRQDFFEFYWAHLMHGTELVDIIDWVKMLLWRPSKDIPKNLHKEYIALFIVVGILGALALVAAAGLFFSGKVALTAVALASVLLAFIKSRVLLPVVGDAARYLSPTPRNVARRTAIRAAGLSLVKRLHDSGKYDRIIIVGHSLGSVIGYDLMRYYWSEIVKDVIPDDDQKTAFDDLLREVELSSKTVTEHPGNEAAYLKFRQLQNTLWREIAKINNRKDNPVWLISDFVTMGSPLAHGNVLLAATLVGFKQQKRMRELPTVPPYLEHLNPPKFTYDSNGKTYQHHAALFSCTRWTNIYFPVDWVVGGDAVGGPVRKIFGNGIRDVAVHTSRQYGLASHNFYWSRYNEDKLGADSVRSYISALRRALNLLDEDEVALWGELADKAKTEGGDFSPRPKYEKPD